MSALILLRSLIAVAHLALFVYLLIAVVPLAFTAALLLMEAVMYLTDPAK